MSIVYDQIRRVDGQLDRLQFSLDAASASHFDATHVEDGLFDDNQSVRIQITPSARINELQAIIKALSATSSSKALLPSWRISTLLDRASLADSIAELGTQQEEDEEYGEVDAYEAELEWLLIGKATVQTYGLILNTLLEETIPLSDDIWYWDEVLSSHTYTGLYTIQTSPLRLWDWTKDIYEDTRRRLMYLRHNNEEHDENEEGFSAQNLGTGLLDQWKQFYGLVQESIRDRSMVDIQRRVLSPIALCRSEARNKQTHLKRLREMSASGLGVLMDEGLSFDLDEDDNGSVKAHALHEWKGVVERSVALMDTVLRNVTTLETGVHDFEDAVFASVEDDPEVSPRDQDTATRPAKLSRRLQHILQVQIPSHTSSSRNLSSTYGRPSIIVRYWLPSTAILLSSTTILRLISTHKATIISSLRDIGSTTQDFIINWIVEPLKSIIATIRHDKESSVAIMSQSSLKGDRDSLERMVVDFAVDNNSSTLNDFEILEIRAKVKEGDLTPVLKAYEKDLRNPFKGAITGDLIRTLLIQVQKTKVDVEVALSGIDSLLKSQELVFGFVGLTPGVLVSFAVLRYVANLEVFSGRRRESKREKGRALRILRNIDKFLGGAVTGDRGVLGYKDHGLVLCEVHQLRRLVVGGGSSKGMTSEVTREFLEDVAELSNIDIGVERQRMVLGRIRWAYGRWLE